MTPATLSTIRRALGLSTRRLGEIMRPPVNYRSVMAWEAGTSRIPAGAAAEILAIEAEVARLAAWESENLRSGPPLILKRLRDVRDLPTHMRPRAPELHLAALAWVRMHVLTATGEGVIVVDQAEGT